MLVVQGLPEVKANSRLETPQATRWVGQTITPMFGQSEITRASSTERISVVVLCVDRVIAAGLEAVLGEHDGFQVVRTPEPSACSESITTVDVVLADYETAMCLVEIAPQALKKLLIFTNHDSEVRVCRALESGARGYLLQGLALSELFEGIRSVHSGGVALSPSVAARVSCRISTKTLTRREKAVLEHMMQGLSNKLIAYQLNVSVGTVKTHVKSILDKLNAQSRTAAVVTAQRRGLVC